MNPHSSSFECEETSSSENSESTTTSDSDSSTSSYDLKSLASNNYNLCELIPETKNSVVKKISNIQSFLPKCNKIIDAPLPRRIGRCNAGEPTLVRVNSFAVNFNRLDSEIYHYDFIVEPEATPAALRTLFFRWRESYLGGRLINECCFDGKRTIFAPLMLPMEPIGAISQVFPVTIFTAQPVNNTLYLPPNKNPNSREKTTYRIIIKLASRLPINVLVDILNGAAPPENSPNLLSTYNTAIDVIFRHAAASLLHPYGRVMFDTRFKVPTGSGMVQIPGYTQAVRTANSRLMLVLDATSALFFEELPVLDILRIALQRKNLETMTSNEISMIERGFRGYKVVKNTSQGLDPKNLLNLDGKQNEKSNLVIPRKYYTIVGLSRQNAANLTFDNNGITVTVLQYYAQELNIRLQYPNLPCAITGTDQLNNKMYLPLELLVIAPNQKVVRSLGKIEIKGYKPSASRPDVRAQQVETAIKSIYAHPGPPTLSAFDLSANTDMLEIVGQTLPPPLLQFNPSSREPNARPIEGRWPMDKHRVYTGAHLRRWVVLPFAQVDQVKINRFITTLSRTMIDMGIKVDCRAPKILPAASPAQVETALQHAYLAASLIKETSNNSEELKDMNDLGNPDLLLVILPDKAFSFYSAVKRVCDISLGVASQCVTSALVCDFRQNQIENIALKINVKLPRGINVLLDPSEIPFVTSIPTMFMGADVTHPAQMIDAPSIASVVGSMDKHAARYSAVARIQPMRAEIILDMGSMVLELLHKFYESTGTHPQRILFFRDGISEGQFNEVLKTEVAAIRMACKALDPDYKPCLTFIVVQKRHHTRFYPPKNNTKGVDQKSGNLLPGLVVDTVVTHPFEFDFYLQSHLGHQGLVKPTRYSVLVDENGFTAESLAQLTYRVCYLYPRGARAVSMVPAAFYAHVAAARAKSHVVSGEKDGQRYFALAMVRPGLEKSMYFM